MKIGDIVKTKYGDCKILRIVNSLKILVKFLATGFKTWCKKYPLEKGKVKDYFHPIVHGVGFLGSKTGFQPKTHPQLYRLWQRVLGRCYYDKYHKTRPSYIGCKVTKRWHNFQLFCKDILKMPNAFKEGFALDKDLRVIGNKTYSRKYCSFVPVAVNSFPTDHGAQRSKYGVGVRKEGKGFLAQTYVDGKHWHSKVCNTAEEASELYFKIKQKEARRLAKLYKNVLHREVYANLIDWKTT